MDRMHLSFFLLAAPFHSTFSLTSLFYHLFFLARRSVVLLGKHQ